MLTGLKQLQYPKEFRIAPPVWPHDLLSLFEKLIQALQTSTSAVQAPTNAEEQPRLLAEVAIGLWRMRQKMVHPETGRPLEEMRKTYRHLESIWDALAQAGIQIRDHTGEIVPEGGVYALKTLAFQPTPGITHEKVIETIKPTIYYTDQMIQMGEVIVGTPEKRTDGSDSRNGGSTTADQS